MTAHPVCGCPLVAVKANRAERRAAHRYGRSVIDAVTLHRVGCPLGVRPDATVRAGVHHAGRT